MTLDELIRQFTRIVEVLAIHEHQLHEAALRGIRHALWARYADLIDVGEEVMARGIMAERYMALREGIE